MSVPITCFISTFNEEERLPAFLSHAKQWADHIVVADKSSTDNTVAIAKAAGARVIWRPYSRQGHEDMIANLAMVETDWVFVMTPGETPTREFIAKMRETLDRCGDTHDIITVPKRLYSLGIHDASSPWSLGQQPMIVNRKRAVITNRVHRNFDLKPGRECIHIQYSPTCYVLHPTHSSVAAFLQSHFDYIIAEANGAESPEQLIDLALRNINGYDFGGHKPELFAQECLWKLYYLGCCAAAWERKRGLDVPELYRQMTQDLLLTEWTSRIT